jgi:hypothetical protein
MNFQVESKTSNIILENLGGGNMYNILKEKENFEPNHCAINKIDIEVYASHKDSKIVSTESTYYSNNTKFYIISLSVIGVYIFSRILSKSKTLK